MRTDIFSVMFVMEPIIHTASGILKKNKKNSIFIDMKRNWELILYNKKIHLPFFKLIFYLFEFPTLTYIFNRLLITETRIQTRFFKDFR